MQVKTFFFDKNCKNICVCQDNLLSLQPLKFRNILYGKTQLVFWTTF